MRSTGIAPISGASAARSTSSLRRRGEIRITASYDGMARLTSGRTTRWSAAIRPSLENAEITSTLPSAADGSVDVISAFSSDGRIAADHLVVLPDVKRAIPSYDAVILISPRRRNDEVLRAALAPLIGAIPVERMRQANYMVDRDSDKATVREAAQFLAPSLERSP